MRSTSLNFEKNRNNHAAKGNSMLSWELPKYDKEQDDIALFKELYNEGTDPERQDEIYALITKNHMRLVMHILRKYFHDLDGLCEAYRCTIDDFYSAGVYGLLKAIRTFNYESDIKLATYASKCIFNELSMFIRNQQRSNTVKGNIHQSMEHVITSDFEGNKITLADILPIDDTSDVFADKDLAWKIWTVLEKRLSKRDIEILKGYILGDLTQKEISAQLNISQSYVSRMIDKILARARAVYQEQMA
jgi:RNA polymerase sporulation-specific sigma factor